MVKRFTYLQRTRNAHSYFSGELWVSDVATGATERLFPGLVLTHFSLSQDGKKVVFATEQGQARSGIWVGWLDRTQAPRQLTFGGEIVLFSEGRERSCIRALKSDQIMRISEDGS